MAAERLTITLPKNISDDLGQFAEELHEKKSHIISEALERYFDYLDLRVVEKRSKELSTKEETTISFDEIKKEFGL